TSRMATPPTTYSKKCANNSPRPNSPTSPWPSPRLTSGTVWRLLFAPNPANISRPVRTRLKQNQPPALRRGKGTPRRARCYHHEVALGDRWICSFFLGCLLLVFIRFGVAFAFRFEATSRTHLWSSRDPRAERSAVAPFKR